MTSLVRDPNELGGWDDEVDVLVVGLGVAGAGVALAAADAGAETLVLERGGGGGGFLAGCAARALRRAREPRRHLADDRAPRQHSRKILRPRSAVRR